MKKKNRWKSPKKKKNLKIKSKKINSNDQYKNPKDLSLQSPYAWARELRLFFILLIFVVCTFFFFFFFEDKEG